MKYMIVVFVALYAFSVSAQTGPYLLIGTYTSGKSEGIYVYNFNSATGDNNYVSVVKASNPSYLAVSPDHKMVYAVSENSDSTRLGVGGKIAAFSFNSKTGTLALVNQQFSGGETSLLCYD